MSYRGRQVKWACVSLNGFAMRGQDSTYSRRAARVTAV